MSAELCTEDMVVHITAPQIISAEETVTSSGAAVVAGGGAGSASELGRRLLLAARAGDTPLVLDLMAKGAPFTTDWLGTSPLHLAASNAHAATCGVLLRAGVSRDSRTKVERTPLHLAAYAGHAAVCALLLEHGALVDCRDMLRMTPLHWAADRGHPQVVKVLLKHGADPRAESKFLKTAAALAAARGHQQVLLMLDDALRQRECARSVRALDSERLAEEPAEPAPQTFTTVQRIQDIKINKPKLIPENIARPEEKQERQEAPPEEAGAGGGGGGGGGEGEAEAAAAQLLRRHGITLLPAEDSGTVLSALQSGRTVVLSDAGKLMLKESGANPPAGAAAGPGPAPGGGAPAPGGRGVVLTATPVRRPPEGVKVFTVNNRLIKPDPDRSPAVKIGTQDLQPIKFVQLPPDARIVARRGRARGPPVSCPRPPVKIIMNKSNFERLVAGAGARLDRAPDLVDLRDAPPAGAGDPAEDDADDAEALRARLVAAQRTVARLTGELRVCRARLARYERD